MKEDELGNPEGLISSRYFKVGKILLPEKVCSNIVLQASKLAGIAAQ